MPRRPPSEADHEREALWLDLVEDGWKVSEIAEMTGYTPQRIRQRLDRARDTRAAQADPQPMVGGEDVWLELTSCGHASNHHYYDLSTDATSLDGTGAVVLINSGRGNGVRRNRLGTGRHVDTGQRYGRGEDDGLKGGVG